MADPKQVFRVFYEHKVEYIVIDMLAAALHGVPVVAKSIVVCPEDTRRNNLALVGALHEMDAKLQISSAEGVDLPITVDLLEKERTMLPVGLGLSFTTKYGILELIYVPRGAGA